MYSFLYAGLTLIFKTIFGFTSGYNFIKIISFTISGCFASILSVVIIFYWEPKVGLYFFVVCMSIFIAPLFSWCQGLPHSTGFHIAPKQFTWISISIGLTLGVTPMIVGILMKASVL